MKKTVLFDIDDTLSITSPKWGIMTKYYMLINEHPKIKDTVYNLEKSYYMTKRETSRYLDYMNNEFPYASLELVKGAREFVQYLLEHCWNVLFITNRPTIRAKDTEEWIRKNLNISSPRVFYKDTKIDFYNLLNQVGVLIDNNVQRCICATKHHVPCILFTGIGVENEEDLTVTDLPKAVDYFNVKLLFEAITHQSLSDINIGDYVKINNDFVFFKYPSISASLRDKYLKVIDLYRDPKTSNLVRVSVTCDGVHNNKSKYDCFYIPGKYVSKVTPASIIEENKNSKKHYFIILDAGSGVKELLSVVVKKST